MAFNKKRACCCGTTETDVAYFEVKSVVPIVAAEQVIDKTYSYWFRRENTTFVSGSVPDSTVLWERGSITNVNSELTADLTYGAWKTAGSATAYVGPSGGDALVGSSNTFVSAGGPPITPGGVPGEAMDKALHRRGWYLDSGTRVLTEAQWDALDECKIELPLPTARNTGSGGNNSIEIYRSSGWMFAGDQYNASPAIGPITKGDLTWEVYPKVNCNYPIGGNVHDFTALFPNTISFDMSGTMPIGFQRVTEGFTIANVSGSGSYTFSKVTSGTGTSSITIQYEQTSPSGSAFVGQVDVTGDDLVGGTFTATLKLQQPGFNNISLFNIGPGTRTNLTLDGTSSNCTTNIGYFPDDPRILCDDCDPNSNGGDADESCSPSNFDGGFLKNKNYQTLTGSRFSPIPDNNTLNSDLTLGTNYPTDEAQTNATAPFQSMLAGLASGPILVWGEANGGTVNIEVKTPPGPGLNSYLDSAPNGRCINAQIWGAGPLVDYFCNETNAFFVFGQGSFTQEVTAGANGMARFIQPD